MKEEEIKSQLLNDVFTQVEEKIKITEWSLTEFQEINQKLESHFTLKNH